MLPINMHLSYSLWRLAGMDLFPVGMSVNSDEYKRCMTSECSHSDVMNPTTLLSQSWSLAKCGRWLRGG